MVYSKFFEAERVPELDTSVPLSAQMLFANPQSQRFNSITAAIGAKFEASVLRKN